MEVQELRQRMLDAINGGGWLERSLTNEFVTINGQDYTDAGAVPVLENLLSDRLIQQVPTPGQSRSTVSYRKADNPA